MCGDSTSIDAVEKLMDGKKADMVFTDPPYGIDEEGDRTKRNGKNSLRKGVKYNNFKDDSTQYAIDAYNLCEGMYIKGRYGGVQIIIVIRYHKVIIGLFGIKGLKKNKKI